MRTGSPNPPHTQRNFRGRAAPPGRGRDCRGSVRLGSLGPPEIPSVAGGPAGQAAPRRPARPPPAPRPPRRGAANPSPGSGALGPPRPVPLRHFPPGRGWAADKRGGRRWAAGPRRLRPSALACLPSIASARLRRSDHAGPGRAGRRAGEGREGERRGGGERRRAEERRGGGPRRGRTRARRLGSGRPRGPKRARADPGRPWPRGADCSGEEPLGHLRPGKPCT